jgi:hypothetical protein
MVKANDLIFIQKNRESKKYITFDKIYNNIEKKIKLSSDGNNYYTWYQIPEFLIGLPFYSLIDCTVYINKKLNDDGFITTLYNNNLLLITWFP